MGQGDQGPRSGRRVQRAARRTPPRVLIEADDALLAWALDTLLGRQGYDPVVCSGPGEVPCPLLRGRSCPLVDQADAVLCALTDEHGPTVLRVHATADPHRPVVADPTTAAPIDVELPSARLLDHPMTTQRVLQAVRDAIGPGRRSPRSRRGFADPD